MCCTRWHLKILLQIPSTFCRPSFDNSIFPAYEHNLSRCVLHVLQVWLASERPGVAGVILHSPLLSGVRVFNPNLKWWPAWADIFPNHLLVKKVDVPLLVLHGTADDVSGLWLQLLFLALEYCCWPFLFC